MKNKPSNKFRKFSNNNKKEGQENKIFSKTKNSTRSEDFKKYQNKSKNNNYFGNNSAKGYEPRNYYINSSKPSNDLNEPNYKNQFRESNLEDFIWGKHSVFAALESNRPINRVWCTSEIRSSEKFFTVLKEIKSKGVLVEEVTWARISQITRGAVHQGIVLQVSYSQTISLDKLISLSKVNKSTPVLICLDGITDPHNVGAIIRSSEAFGCMGVIIPQRRSAGITGTVAKVAAGALENIAVCRVINLNRTLQTLKNEGFLVVGLTEKANLSLSTFKENLPMVIVVGSENKGISLITQKYCDFLLKIPLKGKTTSLNASVAASIFINHITKNN
tara:strand:+ start:1313 stop:2308 length:996 start_codon:yes stop_codon:yes gene_type:complete